MNLTLKHIIAILLLASFTKGILKAQSSQIFYDKAFSVISSMLLGNIKLDFRKAVFLTENAYLEDMLNEDEFKFSINIYTSTCKSIIGSGNIAYVEKDRDVAMA